MFMTTVLWLVHLCMWWSIPSKRSECIPHAISCRTLTFSTFVDSGFELTSAIWQAVHCFGALNSASLEQIPLIFVQDCIAGPFISTAFRVTHNVTHKQTKKTETKIEKIKRINKIKFLRGASLYLQSRMCILMYILTESKRAGRMDSVTSATFAVIVV